MRVLFVSPYVPSRIRVRPYEWIKALAGLGCHVHLVALRPPEDAQLGDGDIRDACGAFEVFPLSRVRTLTNAVRALVSAVPLQAAYSRHPAAEARIRALVAGEPFDVVHIEHLRGSLLVPFPSPRPTVYDAVDCITRLFEQTVRLAPGARQRALARLDLARTRRFESAAVTRFDRLVVSSEAEAEAFRSLAGADAAAGRVHAIGNGVDSGPPPAAARDDGRTVLFAGKLSYHANEAAARRLIDAVMPRVWTRRPDARLIVAGLNPSRALQAMAVPGRIAVPGYVEDLRGLMQRATVLAAPLVYAAGIQNKVLEAMASGTPVITSPSACAALDATIGTDVVSAGTDDAFADRIVELLDDRSRRDAIGRAGRAAVVARHDWRDRARALVDVYGEAIAARGGTVPSPR